MPADVAELFSILPDPTGRVVPYREEIQHPFLATAEVTEGRFFVVDGDLHREQRLPDHELAAIGDELITLRTSGGESANLIPIPTEIKPLILALRALITRNLAVLDGPPVLSARRDEGWSLAFPDLDPTVATLTISGCGARVRQLEITKGTGVKRTITLGSPE